MWLRSKPFTDTKPPAFYQSRDVFWADPYIGSHVVDAHLDAGNNEGSRTAAEIDRSTRWIHDQLASSLPPGGQPYIIDLGCGPGLYAADFAALGCQVLGIDINRQSIRYAKRAYRTPNIRFVSGSYFDLQKIHSRQSPRFRRAPDAVSLIFGEFSTISDADRLNMLQNVRQTLRPGGTFFFDVLTRKYDLEFDLLIAQREQAGGDFATPIRVDWYHKARHGFWSPRPHWALSKVYYYPDSRTIGEQFAVVEPLRTRMRYTWQTYFSKHDVVELLTGAGFEQPQLFGNLCGDEHDPTTGWIGVAARTPATPITA